MGAVAEFENDIIRERVKAGLNNARSKGKRLGRPRVSPLLIPKVKELRAQGLSIRKIEKTLKSKNFLWDNPKYIEKTKLRYGMDMSGFLEDEKLRYVWNTCNFEDVFL